MTLLDEAREEIDAIDAQMAALYEKRMKAVEDVLAYKLEHHLPVLDTAREEAVLEKNAGRIKNEAYRDSYRDVQKYIMEKSRDYQKSLMASEVVAYCGIPGAFGHMVTCKLFPANEKLQFNSFEDVFLAVVNRKAEYGVIPFENTNSGSVGEVLDLLMEYPVFIRSMWDQKIEQCLLGVPGATLKDVEWVYSKDQALMQARVFLKGLDAEPVPYPNTALAAQYVAAQNDKSKAAIAARENAALYNLQVLASNIEENNTNTTRFLVISLNPAAQGSRLGMQLSVSNEVGSLHKIIDIITRHQLNMCTIQSRPRKGHPFEYTFFIEADAKEDTAEFAAAVQDLKEVCEDFKELGCYDIRDTSEAEGILERKESRI